MYYPVTWGDVRYMYLRYPVTWGHIRYTYPVTWGEVRYMYIPSNLRRHYQYIYLPSDLTFSSSVIFASSSSSSWVNLLTSDTRFWAAISFSIWALASLSLSLSSLSLDFSDVVFLSFFFSIKRKRFYNPKLQILYLSIYESLFSECIFYYIIISYKLILYLQIHRKEQNNFFSNNITLMTIPVYIIWQR